MNLMCGLGDFKLGKPSFFCLELCGLQALGENVKREIIAGAVRFD